MRLKKRAEADDAKVRRDWGRALPEHFDESPDKRFAYSLNGVPHDGKFIFNRIGYNFKPVEAQAAFGLVQFSRLPEFSANRRKNFKTLYDFCAQYPQYFILPREIPCGTINWLAFPLTLRSDSSLKRVDLMRFLEGKRVQTRALFSGNIARHPAYQHVGLKVHGDLPNADYILEHSMLLGCHHGLRDEHMDYMLEMIESFIKAKR